LSQAFGEFIEFIIHVFLCLVLVFRGFLCVAADSRRFRTSGTPLQCPAGDGFNAERPRNESQEYVHVPVFVTLFLSPGK
jgi:hypothetical protein